MTTTSIFCAAAAGLGAPAACSLLVCVVLMGTSVTVLAWCGALTLVHQARRSQSRCLHELAGVVSSRMLRAAFTLLLAAAITVRPSVEARQANPQPVQYRSPDGVEYRSLPDTEAVTKARAALDADPKN